MNNTLSEYPRSLEITQDPTIKFSAEVMKLRTDNERLHFELIQAQTRNKELLLCMEQRQAAGADEVKELVDETRDITRHYYEEQLQALRDEEKLTAEKLARGRVEEEASPSVYRRKGYSGLYSDRVLFISVENMI